MAQLRVLLGFSKATDGDLEAAVGAVIKGMTDNPAFPNPPVTMAALTAARDEFLTALSGQVTGGTLATAEKKNKRAALIQLLRQLAAYVQATSDNDLATLLTSGFKVASNNSAQSPLEKPRVTKLANGMSGQIVARVAVVRNARCYEGRFATVTAGGTIGPWQSAGFSTDSRAIEFNHLTPGTLYELQIRAIGGSTGLSDWSDPTQHMSL